MQKFRGIFQCSTTRSIYQANDGQTELWRVFNVVILSNSGNLRKYDECKNYAFFNI